MDSLTALRELLEKVEAGDEHIPTMYWENAFPDCFGYGYMAYNANDHKAALSLMCDVVPEWDYRISRGLCCLTKQLPPLTAHDFTTEVGSHGETTTAILLAVIKAKIFELENDDG